MYLINLLGLHSTTKLLLLLRSLEWFGRKIEEKALGLDQRMLHRENLIGGDNTGVVKYGAETSTYHDDPSFNAEMAFAQIGMLWMLWAQWPPCY